MPHRPASPFPSLLQGALGRTLKDTISAQVVALFNDRSRGERPVVPRLDGLVGPHAVAWRVHGDVTSMMVGGVAGLLLQMLHPAVLAGVWDHSDFRADMHGRLRRTARFVALTTYGGREEAEAAIARVRPNNPRRPARRRAAGAAPRPARPPPPPAGGGRGRGRRSPASAASTTGPAGRCPTAPP